MCLLESPFSVFPGLFGKGWKLLSSSQSEVSSLPSHVLTAGCRKKWSCVFSGVVQCEVKATTRNGSAMKVLSAMERAQFISGSGMVSHRVIRTTLVVLVLSLKVSHPRIQQF